LNLKYSPGSYCWGHLEDYVIDGTGAVQNATAAVGCLGSAQNKIILNFLPWYVEKM